jgi:hypothetical protein
MTHASLGRVAGPLLLVLVGGCGSGLYPVNGKVVWKDGSPATELQGSHVVFDLPEKQTGARGYVQADGSFRLTTDRKDGALPGEYKVLIIEVGRKSLGGPDSSLIAPGAMDARFSDPTTSDLKATVKPGPNEITLTVERAPKQ